MNRTKIVCTLGPASDSPGVLREMAAAGMDVARLNFSHGTREEHGHRARLVREVEEEAGSPLALLQDLQGPKLRIGTLPEDEMTLVEGASLRLTPEGALPDSSSVPCPYPLARDVALNRRIFLADGSLELSVIRIDGEDVICEVVRGGVLRSHQGINLPGTTLAIASVTERDLGDIAFGTILGVDLVAASFIRSAEDLHPLKACFADHPSPPWIIAKIETAQALDNLEAILDEADGVMVARGDLGVEIGLERVPQAQKAIIAEAARRGKIAVTATQMLESMIHHPRPTRAEVCDVANAVFDGTDAVMLSAESAIGDHPVEAVRTLADVSAEAEASPYFRPPLESLHGFGDLRQAASAAAAAAAADLPAAALVVITLTGRMPRLLSRFDLESPILAFSESTDLLRRLAVVRGVHPLPLPTAESADAMVEAALARALDKGLLRRGDRVVVSLTAPSASDELTDILHIHKL